MNKYRILLEVETSLRSDISGQKIHKDNINVGFVATKVATIWTMYFECKGENYNVAIAKYEKKLDSVLMAIAFVMGTYVRPIKVLGLYKSMAGEEKRYCIEQISFKRPIHLLPENISEIESIWQKIDSAHDGSKEIFNLWQAYNAPTIVDSFRNLWVAFENLVGVKMRNIGCDNCNREKYPTFDHKKANELLGKEIKEKIYNKIRKPLFHETDISKINQAQELLETVVKNEMTYHEYFKNIIEDLIRQKYGIKIVGRLKSTTQHEWWSSIRYYEYVAQDVHEEYIIPNNGNKHEIYRDQLPSDF